MVSPEITFCNANEMVLNGKPSLPNSASLPPGASTYQTFLPFVETTTLSEKELVLFSEFEAFTLYL